MPSIGAETAFQLLQSIGDVANFPTDIGPDDSEVQLEDFDPRVRRLLEMGTLDPDVARIVRQKEILRVRAENLRRRMEDTDAKLSKVEEGNDRGLISWLGPVPVGFQLGTFAGIKDPVARFLVDLFLDPLNFIGGIGSITKLGRAAKFLTKAGKVLTTEEKVKALSTGVKALAGTILDPEYAKTLKEALDAQDIKRIVEAVKQAPAKFGDDAIKTVADVDPDLARLLTHEKDVVKELKAAFDLADKKLEPFKAGDYVHQLATGQRAFITGRFPPWPFGFLKEPGQMGALSFSDLVTATKEGRFVQELAKGPKKIIESVKAVGVAGKSEPLRGGAKTIGYASTELTEAGIRGVNPEQVEWLGRAEVAMKDWESAVRGRPEFPNDAVGEAGWTAPSARSALENMQRDIHAVRMASRNIQSALFGLAGGSRELVERVPKAVEAGEEAIAKLAPEEQVVARVWQNFTARARKVGVDFRLMSEEALLEDGLENYVTHVVEFTGSAGEREFRDWAKGILVQRSGRRGEAVKSRFSLERFFPTIEEIEKYIAEHPNYGLKLKTKRIDEIAGYYADAWGLAAVRNRVLGFLKDATMPNGMPAAVTERMVKSADLETVFGRAKSFYWTPKNEIFHNRYFFHNEIRDLAAPLFETDFAAIVRGDWKSGGLAILARSIDAVNSLAKTALFNVNPLFHRMSLAYSNFALLPFRQALAGEVKVWADTKRLIQTAIRDADEARFLSFEKMYQDMLHRRFTIFGEVGMGAEDVVRYMKQSGLVLGHGDIGIQEGFNMLDRWLRMKIEEIPRATLLDRIKADPLRRLQGYNELSDRFLWQVAHINYKTSAWAHIFHAELARAMKGSKGPLTAAAKREIANEVAQIVNHAFGGQLWEALGVTPKFQRLLRWTLLAPDWTVSNLKMAIDLFANAPGIRKTAIGKFLTRDVLIPDMRFRWALGYNMRVALYGFIGANMLNWTFQKYKYGKGRFLWDMDREAFDPITRMKSRIELPWNRADGRRLYMNIFKQFLEPLSFITEGPLQFYKKKMGVWPRIGQTMVWGIDSFGNPISATDAGPYQKILARSFVTTRQFMPISLSGIAQGLRDVAKEEQAEGRGLGAEMVSSILGLSVRSERLRTQRLRTRKQDLEERLAELRALRRRVGG